jgi:hypothetical protein
MRAPSCLRPVILVSSLLLGACGGKSDCDAPKVYAEPGCGDATNGQVELPGPGCYTPCAKEGDACESGTCRRAQINPCVCEVGVGCCAACGGERLLCLP